MPSKMPARPVFGQPVPPPYRCQFHQYFTSSFFYKSVCFFTKVFCAAFIFLLFGFEIFWQKNFGAKAASKTLGKLTTEPHQDLHIHNNINNNSKDLRTASSTSANRMSPLRMGLITPTTCPCLRRVCRPVHRPTP